MENLVLPHVISAGIFNAQLAVKNRSVTKNRKTTMFEIEIPTECGGASYIDDGEHRIDDSCVICAKPGQMRHTRLPFKCYYIHLIIKEGKLYDTLMKLPDFIELSDNKRVREIFIGMCEYYSLETADGELMLQSLILELIYLLSKNAEGSGRRHREKNSNRKVIEQTIDYIRSNLSSELTLEKLAKNAKFTPAYFHKLFKASTGKTLRDYIEYQRIKRSTELLVSTDMTVTDIAYECGFSSQSYFSYAFKRCMGVSPREYARTAVEKYEQGN